MENKINCHQIALTDNITGDHVLMYQQVFFIRTVTMRSFKLMLQQ